MPCSPPDEKDVALGKSMPLYSRNVQIYYSLAHAIKRNQCRRKHVGDFFGIAVGGEKRARFVNQQLIGFKSDLTVGETQLFANLVDGGPQRLVPLRIAQFEIIRRELPTPTHFR